jgi:RNA polymerase sigma factor (sigma-70 family)
MNDWELIHAFVAERSEAAFRQLVERHAGLVYASALRQVRDAHIAQDIAQATFILLARKAHQLRPGTVLAGWLFKTTRYVAAHALRSELRRQKREKEALEMQQLDSADETWQRIAPVFDEALARLSASDRDAILLRYVEGRSLREVGSTLGVSEEAAKKRVQRAVEKLKEVLSRSGVSVAAAALTSALAAHANAAAPAIVATLTSHALAGAGNTSAAALAQEVWAAWRWAKLKWATGIGALALLTFTTILVSQERRDSAAANRVSNEAPATAPAAPLTNDTLEAAAEATNGAEPLPTRALRFRVLAADSGEGVPNARVIVNIVPPAWAEWRQRDDLVTDAEGRCAVPYPADTKRLDVGVMKNGFGTRSAVWPSEGHRGIPNEYTLRVERVTNWIGGWLRAPDDAPVANAELVLSSRGGDHSQRERSREYFGVLNPPAVARSDAQGRWWLQMVPTRNSGFQVSARHPNFAVTPVISTLRQESLADIEDEQLKQLWAGELVTTMRAGHTLTGTVVDEENSPIAGARIRQRSQAELFQTDADGVFNVPQLPAGEWPFTVSAEGFAPVRTNAVIAPGMAPMVVTLKRGAVLRLHVVNENGEGVAGATVGLEQWGPHRMGLEWRVTTDRDGRTEWMSAPCDVELELYATADGHGMTRNIKVKADGEEHTIQLRQVLTVHGRVVDADAGHGIPDFRAIPAYGYNYHEEENRWFAGETVRGTNGLFTLTFSDHQPPYQVKIIADGYEEWVSPPTNHSGTLVLDVALKRYAPGDSVRGVVLKPDGEPAVDAQVALLTFEHNVRLTPKPFLEGNARWLVRADREGAFRFPANRQAHSVAAVSPAGYVLLRLPQSREPVTLQLQPWGRVEVSVDESARTQPVERIELYDPAADNYQGRVSLLGSYSATVDSDGRYVFPRVPPGEFSVFINSGVGITYHHGTPVKVAPGQTTAVTIRGKPGTLVKGRLNPVPDTGTGGHVVLHFNPDPVTPLRLQAQHTEERRNKELEFWNSPAGRGRVNSARHTYSARMYPDGSFVSLGRLPAGKYKFIAVFKNASFSQNVEIGDYPDAVLDLGEIRLR